MITVRVNNKRQADGTREVDKAIRKLKKAMDKEGILKELKERQYFEKPGDRKRKKSARARVRARREQKLKDKGML